MSRQRIMAFICHAVVCLLFPLASSLGFQLYTALFGSPFARGVAIGLAVQLIFAAFVLANALIAMATGLKVKIAITSILAIANLTYLLPQHPLRALFFAGLSGALTLAAIYMSMQLVSERAQRPALTGNNFFGRSAVSKTTHRFFKVAVWVPAALLLSLPFIEYLSRGTESVERMLLAYGLWFGTPAYLAFAMWATWYIKSKSEPSVARLIWWAPLIFIPFYGTPWIAYGLFHAAMGEASGIAMALLWVGFSPYIIMAGYFFAAVSFVIYEIFFRSTSADYDFVRAAPASTSPMAGSTELFGNSVAREGFVSSKDHFASYPRKTFLGQQGLFAYHATLMITDSELERFFELADKVFGQATIKQGTETAYSSSNGSALQLSVRQEFNGLIIEMTTNSRIFLEGLDALFKAPPPPWFAFPKMEPIEAAMNKQGSLEYWWDWFWNPFWEHASEEVRTNYLRDHKASDEWAECLASKPMASTDQGSINVF